MPMSREDHEEILTQLLNPELEQSTRTELLQNLRADYSDVLTDDESYRSKLEKLEKDNSDLVLSNSKLFRQVGIDTSGDPKIKEEEDKQSFSETVTVSQLEKGLV